MPDDIDDTTETTGERIAREFSKNECYLNNHEQRRLAGMIDAATRHAWDNMRDDILMDRHELEGAGLDNDQVNAVLRCVDRHSVAPDAAQKVLAKMRPDDIDTLINDVLALKAKATPTPWKANGDYSIVGSSGERVALTWDDSKDFLVAAANNFVPLAEACKAKDAEIAELRRYTNAVVSGLRWDGDGYSWEPTHGDYREDPPDAIRRAVDAFENERVAKDRQIAALTAERDEARRREQEVNHE